MQRTTIDGRYELSELLGAGGMAEVYLARDVVLDRNVAIKILREQYAEDEEFIERFRREARSVAALSHPNIVPVYDRGESEEDAGAHYIAMEYVSGGTLREYIKDKGPLDPVKAAVVAAQIASALSAAHESGVIHRDIKPQNVLVTETGDVKVADFGIARSGSPAPEACRKGQVMGTASYMAPEQAAGEPATPRSDLYSLGVTMYEMLTREAPFTGERLLAASGERRHESPRPPGKVNPRIPEAMNALVMKLLSKDPADRYTSATELEDSLRRLFNAPAQIAAPESSSAHGAGSPRRSRRSRRKLIPLVGALALIGALSTLGILQASGEGEMIGSLQDIPGAEAVGKAQGALEEPTIGSFGLEDTEEAPLPDVEGLTTEEAQEQLAASGFGTETRARSSSGEDAGRVLEQSAPAGREAEIGSRVLLAVGEGAQGAQGSQAAPRAAVPDLAGLGYGEAADALRETGLVVGDRYETPSATVPAGTVVEQGIAAGETVEPGTAVNLTASSGPTVDTTVDTATDTSIASGQALVPDGSGESAGTTSGSGNGGYYNSRDAGSNALPESPGYSTAPRDDDEEEAGASYRNDPVEATAPAGNLVEEAPQSAAPSPAGPGPPYEPLGIESADGSTGEQY